MLILKDKIVKEDFHGIKLLLQRLLLTISVNISELVDIIISQSGIGSTLKVVDDEDGTVYGVTTIVDFYKNKGKESIKALCESLREKCKQSSPSHLPKLTSCLESSVCFLLNERFINIPGDVATPMFCALRNEIEEAKKKGELSKFDYIVLMTKGVKPSDTKGSSSHENRGPSSSKKKKKAKRREDAQIEFTNQEDEIFFKNATLSFSYCVTKATGFAISGEWDFDDVSMDTYRTVVIVQSSKLDSIIDEIQKIQS